MSFLKKLESIVDVVTDKILMLDSEARQRRSLKYKQKAALDKLSACLCEEASYFTGRKITEEELIQKGKEFNAASKRSQRVSNRCRSRYVNNNFNRAALADTYDAGRYCLPPGRK